MSEGQNTSENPTDSTPAADSSDGDGRENPASGGDDLGEPATGGDDPKKPATGGDDPKKPATGGDDPEESAAEEDTSPETVEDLPGVDPATADALAEASVEVDDLVEGSVTYRDLVAAGVGPDRAAGLRRAYGLPWSVRVGEGDLRERSDALRGLDDEERAWIAASADDWEEHLAVRARRPGRGLAPDDGEREPPERPSLTPPTAIPGIDEAYADLLAEAGIVSVRTLAVADPVKVAATLDIEPNRVTSWHWRAREQTDSYEFL